MIDWINVDFPFYIAAIDLKETTTKKNTYFKHKNGKYILF